MINKWAFTNKQINKHMTETAGCHASLCEWNHYGKGGTF